MKNKLLYAAAIALSILSVNVIAITQEEITGAILMGQGDKIENIKQRIRTGELAPNIRLKFRDTMLISAAASGNAPLVRFLLEHGANKSLRNEHGKTAMDYARQHGYQDVIAALSE